jgi:hypothetical protein
MKACASLRPAGGGGGGGGGGGIFGNSAQSLAYRNCLQQHGVTLPAAGSQPGGFTNNPTFQAAAQACAALRPSRSSTTSTT